jgi:hypothetical protein
LKTQSFRLDLNKPEWEQRERLRPRQQKQNNNTFEKLRINNLLSKEEKWSFN